MRESLRYDFSTNRDDQIAVWYGGQELTYETLRQETHLCANALKSLNIAPDDRVALLVNDSPEFIAAFISICSLGAIAVPINMALRPEAQMAILADCTAELRFD